MDERTSKLIGQLQQGLIDVSNSQIAEILRQAREEALAEARVILKDMMVQALLKQALDEVGFADVQAKACLERSRKDVSSVPQAQPAKTASAALEAIPTASPEIPRAREAAAEHQTQIQQEIEAIRQKIAENEQSLSQLKTSPPAESAPVSQPAPFPEAEPDADEGDGYYVYGIVESKNGLPGDGWPEQGIDPAHPVYALPCRAIQAVVSQVTLKEFGQEALEANLKDPVWLEARVRAHQSVLDTVAADRTLIPMKFCTIYRSESRVQEMLAQHYDDFMEALARLEGKQEWGVKAYCDDKALAQRVGEISDRVKELKAEIGQKSSGAAYFLKKKMDETIAEEVERLSDEYAQRSHNRLSSHAKEAVINPLQSKEITGRKEAMVLNGAYLVAEEQLTAFRAELGSLGGDYGDLGFIYEITGPWPPYNFVSIGFEEGAADESIGG